MSGTGVPPRLAFVDLETTGATPASDRITEIGIVELGPEGVSEWSRLINPQVPISDFIVRLTGIDDALVADAPPFAALADEIEQRLAGRLFIAHNARFDYGFLQQEFRRLGRRFHAPVLCTVKLSRKLEPAQARHNLDALIARHGLAASGRHRALADAQLIHQLWHALERRHGPAHRDAAVAELAAPPRLPPGIDTAALDELPEAHGVYVLRDAAGEPLYVGRSTTVRKRVLAHFSASATKPVDGELMRQAVAVEGIACVGEIDAALQELGLLRRLRPRLNARHDDEACVWRLHDRGEAHWQPELVACSEGLAALDDLYGVFSSRREARRVLLQLAREHRLCLSLLGLEAADRACSAWSAGHCGGACCGREARPRHAARLLAALARYRLKPWPFPAAAVIVEGDRAHLVDRWCHLGTAATESDLWSLLEHGQRRFDRETYRLLVKAAPLLRPWPPAARPDRAEPQLASA